MVFFARIATLYGAMGFRYLLETWSGCIHGKFGKSTSTQGHLNLKQK
jgi:hypothetical protein